MRLVNRYIVAAAVSLAAPALPSTASAQGLGGETIQDAAASFDALKTLVGTWRVSGEPASALRIRFSLIAGGSVLVEEWSRGDQPYSLTLYHRDGDGLVATHYCPQGNQPRLRMVPRTPGEPLRFAFWDATDLDPETEAYLTALAFDLSDKATLVRSETYRDAGVDEPSTLRLVRDRQAPAA